MREIIKLITNEVMKDGALVLNPHKTLVLLRYLEHIAQHLESQDRLVESLNELVRSCG